MRFPKKRKRFVVILFEESGYTFTQLLFSLMITILLLSSLPSFLSLIERISTPPNDLHPYEWQLFMMDIYDELKLANDIKVINNKLYYMKNENSYSIGQYGNVLRYQKNGSGHIVLLQNVKNAEFQKVKQGVQIKVTSLQNVEYKVMLRTFIGSEIINE